MVSDLSRMSQNNALAISAFPFPLSTDMRYNEGQPRTFHAGERRFQNVVIVVEIVFADLFVLPLAEQVTPLKR